MQPWQALNRPEGRLPCVPSWTFIGFGWGGDGRLKSSYHRVYEFLMMVVGQIRACGG